MCNDYTRDVAWAAGLFDAEGSTYRTNDKYGYIKIEVSQSDPETLQELIDITGIGTISGAQYKKTNKKPLWRMAVRKQDEVYSFLTMLWPYLGEVKRQQAIKAGFPEIVCPIQENLSWAGGFFSGDGCFWVDKSRPRVVLVAEQTHPAVIQRFAKEAEIGRVSGPIVKRTSFLPQIILWRWRAFDQPQIHNLFSRMPVSLVMQRKYQEFLSTKTQSNEKIIALIQGAVPAIYGAKFYRTSNAKIFPTAGQSGTTATDVYATLFVGRDSYLVSRFSSQNVRTIIKPIGTAGPLDPLDQFNITGLIFIFQIHLTLVQ